MSQTLRKGWLQRLLGSNAQEAAPEVVQPTEDVQALRQANEAQAALILQLQHQLRLATQQQSSMAKRIQQLADDWPAMYKRYFTSLGDSDREQGKKTRTKRKAKRRAV